MGVSDDVVELLRVKFEALLPHLDERQRRLAVGAEAVQWGHGGIVAVARATGMSKETVRAGIADLEEDAEPTGRVRRAGAGRKPATETDPGLLPALLALVEPDKRGDPIGPLAWTLHSVRTLAGKLTEQGHRTSAMTVRQLLRGAGFSLQGNAKVLEGTQHPDRDAQFRHINTTAAAFLAAGDPVISVDAKKHEDVGAFARPGVRWEPVGNPTRVLDHDFSSYADGKAFPYGIYDVGANTGFVVVGTDHDTASFAVAAIRTWWLEEGRTLYPGARRLLITADAGGSNAARSRVFKAALAQLAAETGLEITVCHLPPGTSKWNKIEHRLFSFISLNWRAHPLASYEVVINLIGATTTGTGLTVTAKLDTGSYPTGIEIGKEHWAALPIQRDTFHGEWNYTLHPAQDLPPLPTEPGPAQPAAPTRTPLDPTRDPLAHPDLTGMPRTDLVQLATRLHDLAPDPTPDRRPRPDQIQFHEQVWATVLHQRGMTQRLVATVFGISPATVKRTVKTITPLLERDGTTITPTPRRLHHLIHLSRYFTPMPSTQP